MVLNMTGQLEITIVNSGSDGNSTLIRDVDTQKVLVMDVGVHAPPGLKYEDVVGVCITHCHNDHIRYIHEYRTKTIFGTHEELTNNKVLRKFEMYADDPDLYTLPNDMITEECLECRVGPFTIKTIPANHDTDAPVHFIVSNGTTSFFYGCDSSVYDTESPTWDAICACDAIMVDCNYSEHSMLTDDGVKQAYSDELKKRIMSSGHASNEYIRKTFDKVVDKMILGHLSINYNTTFKTRYIFSGTKAKVVDRRECPIKFKIGKKHVH